MKVLVLAGLDYSLVNFRLSLLRDLVAAGCEVVAAAPAETTGLSERLRAEGVRFRAVALARAGLNPWADFQTYRALRALCVDERPDLVLSYTIKPVIYGSLAARDAGVPRIHALITGLGTAFHTPGAKGWMLRTVAEFLYRRALAGCSGVFVQNGDIERLFVERGLAERGKLTLVSGSGIDTGHFTPSPVPETVRFLYLGRLLRDKGLAELAEAAAVVRLARRDVVVSLVGPLDQNPTGISAAEVESWVTEGVVERHEACDDVRPHLAACSVYVLPSYHEGMPRSVLEAMAAGRAIITTDTTGCRETIERVPGARPDRDGVEEGANGLLVRVRSASSLAAAMLRLAASPEKVRAMGARSRQIAEQRFDVRMVNRLMLERMGVWPRPADPEVNA